MSGRSAFIVGGGRAVREWRQAVGGADLGRPCRSVTKICMVMAVPVDGAKIILEAILKCFAGEDYNSQEANFDVEKLLKDI